MPYFGTARGSKPLANRLKSTKGTKTRLSKRDYIMSGKTGQISPFSGLQNRIAIGFEPMAEQVIEKCNGLTTDKPILSYFIVISGDLLEYERTNSV